MSVTTSDIAVGVRVRALREGMDLSLRDLAARSGVSAPMLSQVERGATSPTLAIAQRIAAGLDLSLSQLLRLEEGATVSIVRGADPKPTRDAGGHRAEVLTPAVPGQRAELSRHTLAAHAATGGEDDPPMHEPGAREVVHVQAGAIALCIDGARHDLAAGDTVAFDADLPHHFENPGAEPATFLAVVAAGLRRS